MELAADFRAEGYDARRGDAGSIDGECAMNEMKVFEHAMFGQIRTTVIHDDPWFVGKDVAEALGYAKARNAISKHVDDEDRKDAPVQGPLGGARC